MKNIHLLLITVSVIGCLLLSSCAQQIGQATFMSSKTVNFTYKDGAKGNMVVFGTGHSIDDATKDALQKAGSNFDALIDVKIIRRQYYCVLFYIISYKVEGVPVNTSLLKISSINGELYKNYCLAY